MAWNPQKIRMKFIPTFILEDWIYKPRAIGLFELFVVDGKLYGRNLPKIDKPIYRFDTKDRKWYKFCP